MQANLASKTILVTGASSGIGRITCRYLAKEGASVILVARNEQGLTETASLIADSQQCVIPADISDLESIATLVQKGVAWKGKIDGIIHCAGTHICSRLRDTTPKIMADMMSVNCYAFVEMLRCLMKAKKKDEPLHAAAISSFASLGHDKYYIAYAASKAALEAAAKTMAVELVSRNVRINIIRPTFVDTSQLFSPFGSLEERLKETGYQPLGFIPAEDIAAMAAYLMSERAAHMTGVVIPINAGTPC